MKVKPKIALMVALFAIMSIVTAPAATAKSTKPPGNNGTIKIEGHDFDGGHDNDPHVNCDFSLLFYGFDASTRTVDVTFWAWPPSAGKPFVVTPQVGRLHFTFEGSGAGNALNHQEQYRLPTDGLRAVNGQYHYKVRAKVSGSIGADVKYKVFWTKNCPTTTTTTSPPTTVPTTTTIVVPTTTTVPTNTTVPSTPTTSNHPTTPTTPRTAINQVPPPEHKLPRTGSYNETVAKWGFVLSVIGAFVLLVVRRRRFINL